MDWDLDGVSTSLVSNNFLNVNAPSLSVNANNFTFGALASVLRTASKNLNGVTLSNWNRSAVVLSSEVCAQKAAHDLSLDAAWGGEVSLSRLSSLA